MKILVLTSGGLDSSVCLAMAVETYGAKEVMALSVYYGQKNAKELESSEKVAKYYGVKRLVPDLSSVFESVKNCSLLFKSNMSIEQGTYEEQYRNLGGIPSTYVPFRNGLFLSVAASIALENGCDLLCYGAHMDNVAESVYPDCSSFFYTAISDAICIGSGTGLRLIAPFIDKRKSEIVAEGIRLKFPFKLTWSCYEGREKACGKCGTCLDRKMAFAANQMKDPIEYES